MFPIADCLLAEQVADNGDVITKRLQRAGVASKNRSLDEVGCNTIAICWSLLFLQETKILKCLLLRLSKLNFSTKCSQLRSNFVLTKAINMYAFASFLRSQKISITFCSMYTLLVPWCCVFPPPLVLATRSPLLYPLYPKSYVFRLGPGIKSAELSLEVRGRSNRMMS